MAPPLADTPNPRTAKKSCGGSVFGGVPVTAEMPSEAELEAQLVRLTRSRQSGTALQARIAGTRMLLRRRQRERETLERGERARVREERRERDSGELERDREVALSWLRLDIEGDMATLLGVPGFGPEWSEGGSDRTRRIRAEADRILCEPDPLAAWAEWRRSPKF
jgi:hypothetical protein